MLAAASHPLAPAGAYVLAVAATPDGRTAASTSSGDVAVYDAGLTRVAGGVHAAGAAVAGVALPADDAHVALSAGADGVVCVWDARAPGGPAARLASGTNKPLHSVAALPAGRVAAGGDGRVCLWDARAGGKLAAAFTDAHDGDVTAVAGSTGAVLLSAGVDGQLILWSLAGTLNEDDAFLATLNTGVSVAAAGWWAAGSKVCATTDVNGVVTWNAAAAADEDAPGGGGADVDIDDVRPQAAAVAAPAEYVAGCVEVGGRLCVVTGDHGGALALVPLPDTAGTELAPALATLTGGHTATVRAVCAAGDRVVSGGEDGRVIVWGRGGGTTATAAPPPPTPATAAAHGKVRRHGGGSAARRPSPY